jgi:hypothetical protein
VTFSADHVTIDSGALAAAGLVAGSEKGICHIPLDPVSFKVMGKGARQLMYVSWTGQARKGGQLYLQDAVIDFVKLGKHEVTLVGKGGCGSVSTERISHLTRVR